jgi:isopentenyl diphosphate isomerase/L-lactate dehydrogenase-like FMN-dependent dehydrogenase
MQKSKRQFPDFKYFLSLMDWTLPAVFSTKAKMAKVQTVAELAVIAKKKVPKVVYDYVEGGALTELSYKRSAEAFNKVEFTAHTLRDVSQIDTSTEILGKKVDLPILFSPTGYTRFMYHVGEPAVAAVAEKNNLIYLKID